MLHINRPLVDDFGNVVKPSMVVGLPPRSLSHGLPYTEQQTAVWEAEVAAWIDRWETSTSTYGGDTVTDCVVL